MHPQRTRNNIPGIIPQATPNYEGEGVSAPSEGSPLPTSEGEAAQDWYSTPPEKRKITRVKKKIGPPRQSERLNKNMNLPSERKAGMETIQETEDKNMQVG